MKNFQKIFLKIAVITVLFICFYTPALAQVGDYTVLTPLPGISSTPDLKNYLSGMFELAIAISAVLAFVMITWGGITYATSDAMAKTERGREYITNAIYGLILVIGAWAILNTINPKILQFNLNFDIEKFANPTPTVTTGTSSGTGISRLTSQEQINEEARLRQLLLGPDEKNPQVTINKGACIDRAVNCTLVYGLPQQSITALKDLNSLCDVGTKPCNIQITGGTEALHKSHGVGKNIFDLAPDAKLNEYIGAPSYPEHNYTKEVKIHNNTMIFTFERSGYGGSTGDHWHVVIK